MSGKFGLVIGNTEYIDSGLAQLSAPGRDAEDFARVLKDQEIGAFDDVTILLNHPSSPIIEAIDEFFDQRKPDDLLVLYFSGHGIRDDLGLLYLAVKNTNRSRLRSTAIKSDYIREAMDQSRSKRQVLILDCCNSGAFAQGTKAATGVSIGTASAFEGTGYGRVVLTASDSTQFAWEGDKVIGETDNSLFTHFLVKGLEGDADNDGDGRITIDELYDYAYDQIVNVTPKQTPGKWSYKQQGEIVLRQNINLANTKPVSLPEELVDEIEDTRPYVREAAVQKLQKIINGRNRAMAPAAREALEKIAADENTTRRVAQAAMQVLETVRQAEQIALQRAEQARGAIRKLEAEQGEAERALAEQKAEAERVTRESEQAQLLAIERAEANRKSGVEAERLTSEPVAEGSNISAISGPSNQINTGATPRPPGWISVFWIAAVSAIAWPTLWWCMNSLNFYSIDALVDQGRTLHGLSLADAGIGIVIIPFFGAIAINGFVTLFTVLANKILPSWTSVLWITLGWTIAGICSWLANLILFLGVLNSSSSPYGPMWFAGAMSGAMGGFFLIWRLRIAIRNLQISS